MSRCLIVAEAGVCHNGDLNLAYNLVEVARIAGADVVKFQTYIPDVILRDDDPDRWILTKLALPLLDFKLLAARCRESGIEFMSTPECETTLKFLVEECGIRQIKIGSGDLTNTKLLRAARDTKLPIILSTGMSTKNEVQEALSWIGGVPVTIMHCVSCYPCPPQDANLKAVFALRELATNYHMVDVGYSDHTIGQDACIAAVAMGASVIEKHLTLRNLMEGPDHAMSANPVVFQQMVDRIREIEIMLGHGRKEPCAAELASAPKWRKGADGKRGVQA